MLGCRILPSPWKFGKHPLRCYNKAGFSSSPLARISLINGSRVPDLDCQSSLDSEVLVGEPLSQVIFKNTSTKPKHPSSKSNDVSTAIPQAESWPEKEGQIAGSNKTTDVITDEKGREKHASILERTRHLLQKLNGLRSASRDASRVAATAIESTSDASGQESFESLVQPQNGTSRSPKTKTKPKKVTADAKKTLSKKPSTINIKKVKAATESIKSTMLTARKLQMEALSVPKQPPVKTLSYDLDRVLFKQGVYNLQDPRTGVYNFDRYLQKIMPEEEFDFDSLARFKSSSEDTTLQSLAKQHDKKYIGSTSSMTSVLSHFHFLLSNFRPLNLSRISRAYPDPLTTFTEFTRIPTSIYLKYKEGVYAVDSDKEFDRATILSRLGQSLEKLLTVPKDVYEQYRKSSPDKIPDEVKNAPETYHYSSLGNFVFRSQLDGHHEWLPGSGIFDIKTRACVTIRMDQDNYKEMSGYQIKSLYGEWESYEREYLDMLRSTMLKYSLQVRMGRMDGIFVAYHNTEQIFGFQYVPLSEMDLVLHGQEDLALGDQEFKFSVQMLSDVLDMVTERFPHQNIRFHFETRPRSSGLPVMYIFAEPMDSQTMDTVQQAETDTAIQELRDEVSGEVSSSKANGVDEMVTETFEDLEEHDYAAETDLVDSVETPTVEVSPDVDTIRTESELQTSLDQDTNASLSTDASNVVPTDETDFSNDQSKLNDQVQSILPPTQKGGEYSKADSPTKAQSEQPSKIESESDEDKANKSQGERRPVLGFALTAYHMVNGIEVTEVPSMKYLGEWPLQQAQYRKARSGDAPDIDNSWNVSYRIRQFSESDAQAMLRACKARKRKKYEKLYSPDEYREKYIKMMKSLSIRGRDQQRAAEKVFRGNATKQISD